MTIKSPISDYTIDNDKFWGIYRGVVEDRNDPELLGRCRIRVLGIHDELKEKDGINGIPTEELPWYEPCLSLFQGSISGNGCWVVPLQGSYVWVFFENGNWMQGRFFASSPGKPELPPNGEIGFNDPLEEWPSDEWLMESDYHRLAKVDILEFTSLLEVKAPNIVAGVGIAIGGAWSEQAPMYQASYPNNSVLYGYGGVYTELDDTPGQERYHIYHPSNSYLEFGTGGRVVFSNSGTRWDIVKSDRLEYSIGSHHRCVDGNRSSLVNSSEYEEVANSHYKVTGLFHRENIDLVRWHKVSIADITNDNLARSLKTGVINYEYNSLMKTEYTGVYKLQWNSLFYTKVVGLAERDFVGLTRTKFTGLRVEEQIWGDRYTYLTFGDLTESLFPIVFRSSEAIVFEAPTIIFRGNTFNNYTNATYIAGKLTWNGTADGISDSSINTVRAKEIGGEVSVFTVDPQVPEPVIPPLPPIPPAPPISPPGPPPIPPPSAPPEPEPVEYINIPPKPDVCE